MATKENQIQYVLTILGIKDNIALVKVISAKDSYIFIKPYNSNGKATDLFENFNRGIYSKSSSETKIQEGDFVRGTFRIRNNDKDKNPLHIEGLERFDSYEDFINKVIHMLKEKWKMYLEKNYEVWCCLKLVLIFINVYSFEFISVTDITDKKLGKHFKNYYASASKSNWNVSCPTCRGMLHPYTTYEVPIIVPPLEFLEYEDTDDPFS